MNTYKYDLIKNQNNNIYNIRIYNLQDYQRNIIKQLNLQEFINIISNSINFILNHYFNIKIKNYNDKLIISFIKNKTENIKNKELNINISNNLFSNNLKIKIKDNFNNIDIDKINCIFFNLVLYSNNIIDNEDLININQNYIEPVLYDFLENKNLNLDFYIKNYNKDYILDIINNFHFKQNNKNLKNIKDNKILKINNDKNNDIKEKNELEDFNKSIDDIFEIMNDTKKNLKPINHKYIRNKKIY